MTWLSTVGTGLWFLVLPFVVLLRWLLIAIGPALHLGGYIFSWMISPLKFLAKFETIYIYLGVAALIGLITGSILHLSSAVLASVFNLNPTHEDSGRSTASRHSRSEKTTLEETWQSSLSKEKRHRETLLPDNSLEKKYAEWLEKTQGKNKEDQSLFGQTILEEEDNSEDGF